MFYGTYLSAAGANVQNRRLEVISHNLANVDTPGFKPEASIFQARLSEAAEQGTAHPVIGGAEAISGGVQMHETVTSFASGPIKKTGIPTDMALVGDGFFEVADAEGRRMLTRAGDFTLDGAGNLITQQGYSVLSADGEPVAIDPALPYRVLEDGRIAQGGASVALSVVEPQHISELARAGENMFLPLSETRPAADRRIRSGYLEQSAVRPTTAMMEMLEATRAFETNMRMIQNQDSLTRQLVARMLQP